MTDWDDVTGWDLDVPVTVCLTHMRFVPCRADDGNCAFSEDEEDAAAVLAYQMG